jgi:hypothetical protein
MWLCTPSQDIVYFVEIRTEDDDPTVKRGWRRRAILGGLPGIIVGWFALGPAVTIVLAAAVLLTVLLLAWSGPRVNLRLYGSSKPESALLHACSAIERRSGTLDIEPDLVHWTPWKRYSSKLSAFEIPSDQVQTAVLFARHGIPSSCRLELRLTDGKVKNVTVFAPTDAVEDALRALST